MTGYSEDEQALWWAAENGSLGEVERLILKGVNVNFDYGEPLRRACINGNVKVVECLLAAGADIHAINDTPLEMASSFGQLRVVETLIARGATVGAYHQSALRNALRNNNIRVAEYLVTVGADVQEAYEVIRKNVCVSWSLEAAAIMYLAGFKKYEYDDHMILSHFYYFLFLIYPRPKNGYSLQRLWIRCVLRPRIRLGRLAREARNRLDRPPTSLLNTTTPTRDQLVAHLRTAGRRFAREYWLEGIPLFFPDRPDLGPVPDEFLYKPRT